MMTIKRWWVVSSEATSRSPQNAKQRAKQKKTKMLYVRITSSNQIRLFDCSVPAILGGGVSAEISPNTGYPGYPVSWYPVPGYPGTRVPGINTRGTRVPGYYCYLVIPALVVRIPGTRGTSAAN
eukprot:3932949-Rhodomonas_salina.3